MWMWGKDFKKNTTYERNIGKKSGLPDTVRLIFFVGLFVWLFVWPSSLTVREKVLYEKAAKDNLPRKLQCFIKWRAAK